MQESLSHRESDANEPDGRKPRERGTAMRTSDDSGIDYAIRRTSDGKYFVDYGIEPADHDWTWVDDPQLSTAFPTAKQAAAACAIYGLAAPRDAQADSQGAGEPKPADGYEIAAVEWSGDDPIADFEDLVVPSHVYVLQRQSDGKYAVDWAEGDVPCSWTDNRDLAVQSGFPDRDAMLEVARHFGFATEGGAKDGYVLQELEWGLPPAGEA